eukprot:gene26291-17383_t
MAKPLSWFTDTVAKDEEVNDREKEDVCLHDWVAVLPGRKVTDIKTLAEFEALYGQEDKILFDPTFYQFSKEPNTDMTTTWNFDECLDQGSNLCLSPRKTFIWDPTHLEAVRKKDDAQIGLGAPPLSDEETAKEALTQLDILRTEARRVAVFNMAGTPSYVATNAVYNFYGRLTTALDTSTYNAQQSLCTSEANEQ